jgi:plasmid stability protein
MQTGCHEEGEAGRRRYESLAVAGQAVTGCAPTERAQGRARKVSENRSASEILTATSYGRRPLSSLELTACSVLAFRTQLGLTSPIMATLHVRNVPDTVYTKIRSLARAEGRSVNAQVIRLLTTIARDTATTLSVKGALDEARQIRGSRNAGRRGPIGLTLLQEGRRSRERR